MSTANILIVDDNSDNLRTLAAILQEEGYKVRKAISGEIALKTVLAEIPDLILLDIRMPVMDGYEVCFILKQSLITCEIPIIFLSALYDISSKVQAFVNGAVDYITKPFQAEEVLLRVKHQVIIQQQRQQLNQQNQQLKQEIVVRQQLQEKLELLLAITTMVNQASNLTQTLENILRKTCQFIGWNYGEAWTTNQDKTILQLATSWYDSSDLLLSRLWKSRSITIFPKVMVLPVRVFAEQKIEWIEDISHTDETIFLRKEEFIISELKTGFAVPIIIEKQIVAILVFFHRSVITYNQEAIDLVNLILIHLGEFIQRKEAEEALRKANYKLQQLANLDGLTKIPNRRCFDESLIQEWQKMQKEKDSLALILCDIDYFKNYNDHYGHLAGDDCLGQVAQAIMEVCELFGYVVSRYGGEEFVILLSRTNLETSVQIVIKMQEKISQLAIAHQMSLVSDYITLSFGIASRIPTDVFLPESLIQWADIALYESKAKGRNNYSVYLSL